MEASTYFLRKAGTVGFASCICSPGFCAHTSRLPRAVYGRENRLKVSRDEAKFEEENKLKRERHVQVTGCPVSPV